MIEVGKKALITADSWFFAPDGKSYRAVFGTVHGVKTAEETLGIKPNGKSTNWYVEIGNMMLAGCQIHYAIRTESYNACTAQGWNSSAADGINVHQQPCSIYNADEQDAQPPSLAHLNQAPSPGLFYLTFVLNVLYKEACGCRVRWERTILGEAL
jgi:hypothetical protein